MSPRSQSPLSEGEISEDGEKVTKYAPHRKNTDVDSSVRLASSSRSSRPSGREALMNDRKSHFGDHDHVRTRDRSRSPYRRDRSRSRSPYRADRDGKGEKRRRQEDHYGKGTSDPRRHKVYEDKPGRGHGHGSYRDPDRPSQVDHGPAHSDRRERDRASTRDSHGERNRDRSRSPYRAPMANERPHSRAGHAGQVEAGSGRANLPYAQRESIPQPSNGKVITKSTPHVEQQPPVADEASQASQQAESAEPEKKLTEAELIEQRRKKREAIRKKHAATSANDSLLRATLESNLPSADPTPSNEGDGPGANSPPSSANSPGTPRDSSSAPASPAELTGMKDEDLVNPLQVNAATDDQGQAAADYDPAQDMDEDRPDFKRQDVIQEMATQLAPEDEASSNNANKDKKSADEFDMFAEDDIDMFAAEELPADRDASKQARALDESLLDNWDYPDGHYRIINGELLDGRYAVEQQVGKGTFATVVRARDAKTGSKVAIKIACRNDTMFKAGQKEMHFVERLNEKDPEDKRHIVRLLGNFMHKGHLCLVFEGLHMDLREVLKKFGRDVGINLEAVKMYAYQMFQSLLLMKSAEVLHADLKPDNILINEKRTFIKICDFGTATLQQDAELTPYLVSRFYRAPEVILGMDFDYAIDMWAIGCTLYELYAGRILFNGSDNNNMLRVIQECRGKLPNRLIKRAKLADKYFDDSFTFYGLERDKMTGNVVQRPMHFGQGLPGRDLKSRLSGNVNRMEAKVLREHHAFVDLLDKCLQLDPDKRIKPKDALHHHFFARPGAQTKPRTSVASTPTFRPIAVQHAG
ncbi:serine threonine- kinase prp4 [Lecanosticta acicola]|uniref:non-specific serine/threonine protein kinase n=1 Tax=Lecanosticta acicola TaxID=111012 RepID=A0AAI8YVB1_9PEZI|nr:serine threonine- kinase prp4 [Lecanosticta acicola]